MLGDKSLPAAIQSFGGRFGWNDAGNTPNMISAWFEVDGIPCIIEVNDMRAHPETQRPPACATASGSASSSPARAANSAADAAGMYVVGEDGKTKIEKFPGDGGGAHQQNFIDVVRSRRKEDLASKLVDAERSSAIAHLANVSFRSGGTTDAATLDAAFGERETMRRIVADQAKQLADWEIDKPAYQLGRAITVDPAAGTVTTPGIDPTLLRREPRKEFEVPELA